MKGTSERTTFELCSLLWLLVITATAGAVLAVIVFFPARAGAQGTSTQTYIPARYALEMAEVNVTMQQPYGNNTQKMLFKLNTATGEVWVLQLSTISMTNPQVLSAGWIKVVKAVQTPNINQPF